MARIEIDGQALAEAYIDLIDTTISDNDVSIYSFIKEFSNADSDDHIYISQDEIFEFEKQLKEYLDGWLNVDVGALERNYNNS